MKYYQCLVNGRNFLLDMDGKPKKYGFYKMIFVDSLSPEQAAIDAVKFVKNSDLKGMVLNAQNDSPKLLIEEIQELEESASDENRSGHTFYKEKKWWQFWK